MGRKGQICTCCKVLGTLGFQYIKSKDPACIHYTIHDISNKCVIEIDMVFKIKFNIKYIS